MVFYTMLYTISPHSYKFLRNSGNIIPHTRTIQKLSAKFNTNPKNEQSDDNFLKYIKEKFTFLKSEDLTDLFVSMMVDEIYLKPYLDYKGGDIVWMAYNCKNTVTTAFVFMVQSILSSFKEVIQIVLVKKHYCRRIVFFN